MYRPGKGLMIKLVKITRVFEYGLNILKGCNNMLKLEQVSKIYSAHGVISTGFNKVSLEFQPGEFIAITGESGSGKSTLLNVISGLDSYEEGEMYINGQPTSGYTSQEFEDYRKEYIGNIFQSFNLINSYTVLENVEMVLLLSGADKKAARNRAEEIIEKVGLSSLKKTKAAKLSGGQKQRVAIARALAKDTPIIVADEPTGNIDQKAAAEIIKLLHDISKDKLVLIVTHNFEQVEPYVTRKIKMHDGRVVEDERYESIDTQIKTQQDTLETHAKAQKTLRNKSHLKAQAGNLSTKEMIRLGCRNTFNIPAKFLLLLLVFIFMWSGIMSAFSSSKNITDAISRDGYNSYFLDISDERVVITKKDKSPITQRDIDKLKKISNVDKVFAEDILLDTNLMIQALTEKPEDNNIYSNVLIRDIALLDKDMDLKRGHMATGKNQGVLIYENSRGNYMEYLEDEILSEKIGVFNNDTGMRLAGLTVDFTGIGTTSEELSKNSGQWIDAAIYLPSQMVESLNLAILEGYCKQQLDLGDKELKFSNDDGPYYLATNEKVPAGQLYIPEDIAAYVDFKAEGKETTLHNESIYFKDKYDFTIGRVYTEDNCNSLLGIEKYEQAAGYIYLNPADYNKIFQKENYQSSVYVKDVQNKVATIQKLQAAGYETLDIANSKIVYGANALVGKTIYTGMMICTILVLFLISYFIVKLILKSRNSYFSITRMLGATKKNCAAMLRVELFIVYNIAFAIGLLMLAMVKGGIITIDYLVTIVGVLQPINLLALYVVMGLMTILLANRYAKKMFKDSAMDAFREEV